LHPVSPFTSGETGILQDCEDRMRNSYIVKERRWGYAFIAAPFIQFFIFGLIPVIFSLYTSLTNWNLLSDLKFIGIQNYRDMLSDVYFWKSLYNTLIYFAGIPIGIMVALPLAIMMNRNVAGNRLFRVIYYLPSISSIVAISILWQWIYNANYGLLNDFLSIFGIDGPNWLGNPAFVKPSLIIMGVWGGLGPMIIMLIASLKNVPESLYEAAEIDGAGEITIFFRITLPMITPVLFYFLVIGFINNMQAFASIYVMFPTAPPAPIGGPEYSAASLVFYLWEKGFKNYQMGYASSVAWVLAIITFIVTYVQFKYGKSWVYENN
jgi:multiple sugar transport system permease protein